VTTGSETHGHARKTGDWIVKDSKGFVMLLQDVRFNRTPSLSGTVGEGKIEIDMTNVSSICIENSGVQWVASVDGIDRGRIVLDVDEKTLLSGESQFGRYEIPLEKVSEIHVSGDEKKSSNIKHQSR
jgi:hypothetical protein